MPAPAPCSAGTVTVTDTDRSALGHQTDQVKGSVKMSSQRAREVHVAVSTETAA